VKTCRYFGDQYLLENFAENSIETRIWNYLKTMPTDNILTKAFFAGAQK
jgi:hypothetical protein